jgi:topoisomerase-4 subunit B
MSYNSKDIEVLSGLDPVRKRPGMYTDTDCPNHLAQEVIDNSIDEAIGGHCDTIEIKFLKDHSLCVTDNGRGMPVDMHPTEGMPGVEVILEKLHAGGKFGGGSYGHSGGLHGVGISVVNALSTLLDVKIIRGGQQYGVIYENGEKTKSLFKIKKAPKKETGTIVHFYPDKSYFDRQPFARDRLIQLIKDKSMLCPGLNVQVIDEIDDVEHNFCFTDGIKGFVSSHDGAESPCAGAIFSEGIDKEDKHISWACYWSEEKSTLGKSFVNLIPTVRHGTHINGFKDGLFKAVKDFADFHSIETKKVKISPDDVWKSINYVVSFKMLEPSFSGQTKECLSSRPAALFVSPLVKDELSLFLNSDVERGKVLCELFMNNAAIRTKAATKVDRKKIGKLGALPGKLTDCSITDRDQAEVFIVEGDSAGGSAKQARDRITQAILPLRGKILNTWEVDSDLVLNSKEISDISTAIGVSPNSHDFSELRYGKICILADADSDGAHIATLAICLFVRHFYPLVERGHIFIAMPPLYRIDIGKHVFYALDDEEKDDRLAKIASEKLRGKVNVQRFKGLGEMNPPQLKVTTLDPLTRRLVQLTADDADALMECMSMLMKKSRASDRLEFITENSDVELAE